MSIIDNREVIDIVVEVNYQEKGDTGKSAYEFAVEQGFVGTEEEWIESLKQPALDAAQEALDASETANQAAQNADDKANLANTAANDANSSAQNADDKAQLANQAAIDADNAANRANTAAEDTEEATQDAITATGNAVTATGEAQAATQNAITATTYAEIATQEAQYATQDAITATGNANNATTNANNAADSANQAAQDATDAADFARSQKGWSPTSIDETQLDGRVLRKLTGYIGGTGNPPSDDNIGKWFADGGFTDDKDLAIDYKGKEPSITIGLNNHWFIDGVDTGKVASTGINNMDAVYGVQFNTTHAAPVLERIGENMFNHVALPVQSKMRRCIVNLDRTVNYYLHKDDSTLKEDGSPADLSGADGQFMLEIPAHYERYSQGGDMFRAEWSLYPFVGATFHSAKLMSISHATVQRSTNTAMCIVNDDPDYAGGGSGVNVYNSMPRTAVSRAAFRTYCRNLGEGWEAYSYTNHKTVRWAYLIEYANFNCKLPFIAERTPEGYAQGGLGNGVTNATGSGWTDFNGQYPFVSIGYTVSLGNNSGEKELIIPDFGGSELITQVPSYRGIENPFGHIFTILEGIQSMFIKGESFNTYVTDNPDLYNDTNHDGFRFVGSMPIGANGYITEMHLGEHGDVVTKSNIGGSSTTYMCDYQYLPSSINEYKWNAVGGHASLGAAAGVGCVNSLTRVSNETAHFGFRLCCERKTENGGI